MSRIRIVVEIDVQNDTIEIAEAEAKNFVMDRLSSVNSGSNDIHSVYAVHTIEEYVAEAEKRANAILTDLRQFITENPNVIPEEMRPQAAFLFTDDLLF